MITLFKALTMIFGMVFLSVVMAANSVTTAIGPKIENLMVIQVVQSEMIFDKTMIASATIVPPTNGSDEYGVHVKLTTSAANQLGNLSQPNLGKQANIILNGILVSSPTLQSRLGGDFIIAGLTNDEANQFVNSLALGQ